MQEYLGLEGGPPTFRQDFTCPALLKSFDITFAYGAVTHYGRAFQRIPIHSQKSPNPGSLTTTTGISINILSSGY